jgi:hypothetical protein
MAGRTYSRAIRGGATVPQSASMLCKLDDVLTGLPKFGSSGRAVDKLPVAVLQRAAQLER